MEALRFEATVDKPEVIFSPEENIFSIHGRSMPENAREIYDEMIEWFHAYSVHPNEETIMDIHLDYFNSSSARKLVELIFVLEEISENGKKAAVNWLYKEGDQIMRDRGEEIERVVDVSFNYQSV